MDRRSRHVTPMDVSITLQASVLALVAALGFAAKDGTVCSLRAAGAMALLCSHVNSDSIRLLGRWRSDEMLCYLTVQAQPIMRNFSHRMPSGGQYMPLPNSLVLIV
jgi:hypothetical protein